MFREGEVVWHRLQDNLWWPARIIEVVQCLRQQANIFNLYQVQPFDRGGGYSLLKLFRSFAEVGELEKFDAMPRHCSVSAKMRLALALAEKEHDQFLRVQTDRKHVKELRSCLKSHLKRTEKRVTWRDQQPPLTIDSQTKKTVIQRLAGKMRRANRKLTSRQAWNLAAGFERESQFLSRNQLEYQTLISKTVDEIGRMGCDASG